MISVEPLGEYTVLQNVLILVIVGIMPGLVLTPEVQFKTIQIKKLHPTFAAEIEGVDFSKPISDDVFNEILAASAKVCIGKMLLCVVDVQSLIVR